MPRTQDVEYDGLEQGSEPAQGATSDDEHEGLLCGLVDVLLSFKSMSALLLCIPFGFLSFFLEWPKWVVFLCNFLSILPMAWLIGKSTEDLAEKTGDLIGGLLNATFGNVVEMLLCVAGIHQDQIAVVQCTLIGSILSNLLLVMGTSFIYGGMYYHTQSFSVGGAGAHSSLLLLSVLGLMLPTIYHIIIKDRQALNEISRWSSGLLLFVYAQYLYFQIFSHSELFEAPKDGEDSEDDDDEPKMTPWCATGVLATCTILTACCSEFLIGAIEGTIQSWGISKEFIGIIILPIIGNAAEHYTAIVVAGKNKMDLSLAVAVGSSCQMALLVTPFTVMAGWVFGKDMTLVDRKSVV